MWENLLKRLLRKLVRVGTLVVYLPQDAAMRFGDGGIPRVTVHITDPAWVVRLARNPDLALGEAYMEGALTIAEDDLHGLMQLLMQNLPNGGRLWVHRMAEWGRMLRRRVDQGNGHKKSRRNVASHYDLTGAFYDLFLDADRQYSCAYFQSEDDSLQQAQAQKKSHIARKLLLRPGMSVLDIGCGWGGLAMTLARDYGAQVLGVTLSTEQHALACARVRAAGLTDRVDIQLMDYRKVIGQFDRIVSVGMFEHVGVPNFRTYFAALHRLLVPDGVALIHTIGRGCPPGATNPFIARHIFPGGYVPALSEIMTALEKEPLWVADIECLRLHYAKTLRHWLTRFDANIDKAAALYDDRFVRMWRFYLITSEQCFRFDRQEVFQLQLSRKVDAVPITRDYLYPASMPQDAAKALIAAK